MTALLPLRRHSLAAALAAAMLLVAAATLAGGSPPAGQAEASKATTWDGVYTEAQAARGMQVINERCVICHASNLQGGPAVPTLVGPAFTFKWNGKPLRELFDVMRSTMPPGQAGILDEQNYADVLAAILQSNEFPAGQAQELHADLPALTAIQIRRDKP